MDQDRAQEQAKEADQREIGRAEIRWFDDFTLAISWSGAPGPAAFWSAAATLTNIANRDYQRSLDVAEAIPQPTIVVADRLPPGRPS